jgi:hypothetical protein
VADTEDDDSVLTAIALLVVDVAVCAERTVADRLAVAAAETETDAVTDADALRCARMADDTSVVAVCDARTDADGVAVADLADCAAESSDAVTVWDE